MGISSRALQLLRVMLRRMRMKTSFLCLALGLFDHLAPEDALLLHMLFYLYRPQPPLRMISPTKMTVKIP